MSIRQVLVIQNDAIKTNFNYVNKQYFNICTISSICKQVEFKVVDLDRGTESLDRSMPPLQPTKNVTISSLVKTPLSCLTAMLQQLTQINSFQCPKNTTSFALTLLWCTGILEIILIKCLLTFANRLCPFQSDPESAST